MPPATGPIQGIARAEWPGSVFEQLKVIGPLTDPTAFGGRAEDWGVELLPIPLFHELAYRSPQCFQTGNLPNPP